MEKEKVGLKGECVRFMLMNIQIAAMFNNQMLPEKSKETQLVARVAKRIISSNMDIPNIKTIKWTVRVVVSYC